MKHIKHIIFISICILLSACSSTKTNQNAMMLEVNTSYSSTKKVYASDHELMASLLQRPTPADHILMQQFASGQNFYETQTSPNNATPLVAFVSIRGDKTEDPADKISAMKLKLNNMIESQKQSQNMTYEDNPYIRILGPL